MSLQTNDGVKFYDRKNLKNNYWYPNMSKSEIATVRRIAKYELSTTENYIDNNTKWLYNERNGKTFLLYIALRMYMSLPFCMLVKVKEQKMSMCGLRYL